MKNQKSINLVSACLLGINCRYNGRNKLNKKVVKLCQRERCLLVCPEVCSGLTIPRVPCEFSKGDGKAVLEGKSKVLGKDGKDYTKYFLLGARKSFKIAKAFKVKKAILKSKSTSCGKGKVYNGTFSGKLKRGDGVFTALLKENKIKVKTENEI